MSVKKDTQNRQTKNLYNTRFQKLTQNSATETDQMAQTQIIQDYQPNSARGASTDRVRYPRNSAR